MGTTANIGIEQEDGTIKAVYCNFEGGLLETGEMLESFYNSKEKALEILENGDMSYLGDSISSTEFYTKRGEKKESPRSFPSPESYNDMDYNYYFSLKGQWMVVLYSQNYKPITLDEAIGNALEREREKARARGRGRR